MTEPNPSDIEKRLDAGDWLSVIEVTTLLKPYRPRLSRTTVHRWVVRGKIGHRQVGSQRTLNPKDVRRILDESRQERRGVNGSS